MLNVTVEHVGSFPALLIYYELAVPGMRCNASRKPPFRWTSHEVR
jgi:hypothetical protein